MALVGHVLVPKAFSGIIAWTPLAISHPGLTKARFVINFELTNHYAFKSTFSCRQPFCHTPDRIRVVIVSGMTFLICFWFAPFISSRGTRSSLREEPILDIPPNMSFVALEFWVENALLEEVSRLSIQCQGMPVLEESSNLAHLDAFQAPPLEI